MKNTLIALALLPFGSLWAMEIQPIPSAEQLPVARITEHGKAYLVDPLGFSLYRFDKDSQGKSTCYAECAQNWPPLLASATEVKAGLGKAADAGFALLQRQDGQYQWSYRGHPLYRWVKDSAPGQSSGDGVKNVWHRVQL
jgi:predicted lipoprotein with Yx(FWY)xxD motif